MSDPQDYWQKFCEDFDKAVFDCADKGEHRRLQIEFNDAPNPVVIDVYPKGSTMKKFDEIILKTVKDQLGVKVVK